MKTANFSQHSALKTKRAATLRRLTWLAGVFAVVGCSNSSTPGAGKTTTTSGSIPCIVAGANNVFDCKAKAQVYFDTQSVATTNNETIGLNVASAATGTDSAGDYLFTISNTGSSTAAADLIVDSMELDYVPAGPLEDASTGDLAFTCWDSQKKESCDKHKFSAIVPTGFADANANRVTAEHFIIHFKQFDANARHATLKITFRDDPDLTASSGGVYTINLQTKLGTPQIKIDPPEIDWATVTPNTQDHSMFTVRNQGDGVLTCASFLFTASAPIFTIDQLSTLTNIPTSDNTVTLQEPLVVPVAGAVDVHVTVSPTNANLQTATLTLFCNDPSQPSGTAIPMKVNAEVPCINLDPTAINFGGVLAAGGQNTRTVTVSSCGGAQLCLGGFDFTDSTASPGEFTMDFTPMKAICPTIDVKVGPTKDAPCCVPVNGKTTFNVNYAPVDVSPPDPNNAGQQLPDTVKIEVTSNTYSNPLPSVAVSGTGVLQTCPIAKIDVVEGDEVVPQTLLHLKGDGSTGAGGQPIKTYSWTAQQPAGSAQSFTPSKTFPNPTFLPNAAGEYNFCLDVTDANGVKSCATTCQKVLVVPNDAVHVELLWDTPADPDQTDTGPGAGADEDLHFANYLASGPDIDCDGTGDPWFNNPFDCFWFNSSPQWGSADPAIKDDPTLDLDDTDGAGPENVNLQSPEGTPNLPRFYSIGVHYWNDHGFGVSYSTINVYLFGALALHIDKVLQNPLDMWYVGKLNWPNQLTGGNSTPPLSVCYQTPGSKPGDVCTGTAKMWQPKGEWCITPCYVNPTFAATTGGATPLNCK